MMPRLLVRFALSFLLLPLGGTGGSAALAQGLTADDLKYRYSAFERVSWDVDIVWDRIDDFFDRRDDIELIRLDRDARTLIAVRPGVNRTGWVTCEATDLAELQVDMRVEVVVAPAGEGTGVTVSTYFLADGQPLPDCLPTGEFAEMLFRAL